MDWVLHDRTATVANHTHNLLLVVIYCLGAPCLAFLHRMARGGNLRCEHLLSYWMMLHLLYLEIRRRYC